MQTSTDVEHGAPVQTVNVERGEVVAVSKELDAVIHMKLQEMANSADEIGTLHFDGDFTAYMQDFLKYLGPVFNAMMESVVNPSPTPVEKNVDAWMKWTADLQCIPDPDGPGHQDKDWSR